MDKVKMVLLKQSEIWHDGAPPGAASAADMQKYRDMYKKPLPDKFIAAVEALIDGSTQGKGKEISKTGQTICA